jgi:PPP family 3-phenylpropionic acid transporter
MDPIKQQAIYIRGLYFLLFIGIGAGSPFFSAFFKHVLVNADGSPNTNLIMTIYIFLPYIGLIANPASAVISDRFGLGKRLITFTCIAGAILCVCLAQTAESWTAAWTVHAKFLVIFPLMLLSSFFIQPLNTLVDAETMRFLNRHSNRERYGTFRLWGTFGWSVSCIVMGWLVSVSDHEALIFYGSAFGYCLVAVATIKGLQVKPSAQPIKIPWNHLKKDTMFQWFLAFVFIEGIISIACYNYMAFFFDDVMHSYFYMGLIFGTWTILEIPAMMYSHKLLQWIGNRWLIVVGMGFNALRLILFSRFTLETSFTEKFFVALLQGPAFAFTFNGFMDFVDRQAHDHMRATYLSLMNIARLTVAGSLGGLFGGMIISAWGTSALMRTGGIVIGVLAVFFLIFVRGHGPGKSPVRETVAGS